MIKVGIVGATGYTGAELVRLLKSHPKAEITVLTTRSSVGADISEVYPGLRGCVQHTCVEYDPDAVIPSVDVVVIALPHGHAVPTALDALQAGKKVIDLGADFRLKDTGEYRKWYGLEHGSPEILSRAVYGLPEVNADKIAGADVVANPGCYPTSIILALAPLLSEGIIKTAGITADSKSGISGAGKTPSEKTHFVECNENVSAYGVSGHRHRPEIEQVIGELSGEKMRISLTPHLVPITRGILSTVYADLKDDASEEELRTLFEDYYRGASFISVLPDGIWPHTRWVYGSNFCHINFFLDREMGRITVVSAIDNLVKGASGQAVQNMNLMFGLPEETGLVVPGIYP